MYYAFKPNPKQLACNKAYGTFGHDAKVNVTGSRPSPLDCKRLDIPEGVYYVECFVNEQLVATAFSRNWRKAYNLLANKISGDK